MIFTFWKIVNVDLLWGEWGESLLWESCQWVGSERLILQVD